MFPVLSFDIDAKRECFLMLDKVTSFWISKCHYILLLVFSCQVQKLFWPRRKDFNISIPVLVLRSAHVLGASLVLHLSLPITNIFNKTEAAIFSMRTSLLRTSLFSQISLPKSLSQTSTKHKLFILWAQN